MKILDAFSGKDIRTSARVIRVLFANGKSIEDLYEYSKKTLSVTPVKMKRTPEERLARKRLLAGMEYGRIKLRP